MQHNTDFDRISEQTANALPDVLNSTFAQLTDAFIATDKQWTISYLNNKAGELLPPPHHNLIGKNLLQELILGDRKSLSTACLEALDSLSPTVTELHHNNLIDKHQVCIYPAANGLLIFISKIPAQASDQEPLLRVQKELEDFKEALNSSSIVSTTDANGYITWVNDSFCAFSQCTVSEVLGNVHPILNNSIHSQEVSEQIWNTFKKGEIWKGEVANYAKDGSIIWASTTILPIKDDEGNPVRSIIICRDITQQKKAEKDLLEREKLYRTLIENYSDAILLIDLQGKITKVNSLTLALTATPETALLNTNFLDYLSDEIRSKISTALPILLQGQVLELKSVITAFQKPFSAVISLVPVHLEGVLKSFFVKLRDVSKIEEHEKDLALLNDTTLALSTAPSLKEGITEVLRLVSHFTNAQYAEFWMPLFGQPLARLRSCWPLNNEYRLMRAAAEHKSYDIRIDKPQLFGTKKWFFEGNITVSPNIRRKAEAKSCGLNSCLAVPIIYRDKLFGLISLFMSADHQQPPLDADKLQLLVSKLGSELERRQSTEEIDKFFAVSPELLGIFTFDGYARKFNPAFEKLLQYTEEEIYQLNIPELVHPADHDKLAQARGAMHAGHSFQNLELRFRTKDGNYRWVSCTTQSIQEEGLTYLAARDITEQKLEREEIERIKIAIDNTSDAVGISSSMEKCIYTNQSFERLLGWNVEKVNAIGGPKAIFALPNLPAIITEEVFTKGYYHGDVELLDSEGNTRLFNLRANTLSNGSNKVKYLVGIFTDVSEFKKAQHLILKLNRAVEESANEIYVIDADNFNFTYMNKKGRLNLGYKKEEITSLTPRKINAPYSQFANKRVLQPLLSGKVKTLMFKTQHQRKDGSTYPVEAHLSLFQDGAERAIMAHVIDVSERVQAEEALMLSNERYQLVTRATNDAIWDIDPKKQLCYYGEGYHTLFGHSFGNSYGPSEWWAVLIHPEDAERVLGNFDSVLANRNQEWIIEYRFKCTNGSYKHVKDRGYVIYDKQGNPTRIAGALADISEQKNSEALLKEFNESLAKKVEEKTSKLAHALRLMRYEVIARIKTEESLHQSVAEKEVLLKEIHHRVKNNMAIISGLLSLQARNTKQPELKEALKDSQSRIKSMALIHELLYQSHDLSKINFKTYVQELTAGIAQSFRSMDKEIAIEIDAEDAELNILHAVPCALILNELITNSFKYAFKEQQQGCIIISFNHTGGGFKLVCSDNGAGLPQDFNAFKTKSLGMQLVCSLVRQIGGEMQVNSLHGSSFTILWPNT